MGPGKGSAYRVCMHAKVMKVEPLNCPRCKSDNTRQAQKTTSLGYRIFRCPGCQAMFNEWTGTAFNLVQCPTDVVLLVVLWRLRYKLSLRDLVEMFAIRGYEFTHETVREWEARFAPLLSAQLKTKRRRAGRQVVVHRRDVCEDQRPLALSVPGD